jgi:hypothetical protein
MMLADRKFLTVIGVCVLFAGCTISVPPCPAPGGIDKTSKTNCYHLLTITQKDPELRGRVATSALEANRQQQPWHASTFEIKDYPIHEYCLDLSNPADKSSLVEGKDYWFVSSPDTPHLKLIADEDLPKHENFLPTSALPRRSKSAE